jgi:hypothetical protein
MVTTALARYGGAKNGRDGGPARALAYHWHAFVGDRMCEER